MCFCCCCISFLKGGYTLFQLYYFFATLIFNGKQAKVRVLFRKTSGMRNCYLENFIKTDKMKCLRTISDSKI